MVVIGGDGGLLEHPQRQHALTLAPGQRADLLVNLTGLAVGTEVHLDSQAFTEADAGGGRMGMMGMMGGGSKVPNGSALAHNDTAHTRSRGHSIPRTRTPFLV